MIYVFKNGTGYQEFPVPTDMTGFLAVGGITEQRIRAGDPYRLLHNGETLEFLSDAERAQQALDEAKPEKEKEIDTARRDTEVAGLSYTFPDGSTGTVQLRHAEDKANITALVLAAQADATATFEFRDGEDVLHTMTAAEVIALGSAVQVFISTNYAHGWDLKDQVAAATTVAEVEAITWE